MGSRGCMLHRAGINLDDRLRVLVVGIIDAGIVRKKAHHLGSFAHIIARIVFAIRANIIVDRFPVVGIFDDREFADHQRDQVRGMRYVMSPVMGFCHAMVANADQVAIGDGLEMCRDSDNDLGRSAIIGRVMTGEPVAVVARLPKCPGLHRASRVLGRWLDKMQASARLRMILYSNGELFAIVVRAIKCQSKLLGIIAEG